MGCAKGFWAAAAAAGALMLAGQASAATVTLTMDEVANQPIDGLTVSKGGLDFTFSNPDGALEYNSTGPGDTAYVNDPSIQGAATPFSVSFSAPVHFIRFGLAESTEVPVLDVSVVLSNGDAFTFDLMPLIEFAEGQFTWHGAADVTGFTLSNSPTTSPLAFAFDNLTVSTDAAAAPEPGTWALMLLGFGGLGGALRRQRGLLPA